MCYSFEILQGLLSNKKFRNPMKKIFGESPLHPQLTLLWPENGEIWWNRLCRHTWRKISASADGERGPPSALAELIRSFWSWLFYWLISGYIECRDRLFYFYIECRNRIIYEKKSMVGRSPQNRVWWMIPWQGWTILFVFFKQYDTSTIPGLQYRNTIPYQYQCNNN